jgi:hypothetical protein
LWETPIVCVHEWVGGREVDLTRSSGVSALNPLARSQLLKMSSVRFVTPYSTANRSIDRQFSWLMSGLSEKAVGQSPRRKGSNSASFFPSRGMVSLGSSVRDFDEESLLERAI